MTAKEFWTKFLKSQRQNLKKEESKPVVRVESRASAATADEPSSLDMMFSKLTLTPEQGTRNFEGNFERA